MPQLIPLYVILECHTSQQDLSVSSPVSFTHITVGNITLILRDIMLPR